jgi:hypothetical protein
MITRDGRYQVQTLDMPSGQVLIRRTGGPTWRWLIGLDHEMWVPASPDEIARYHTPPEVPR